MKTRRIKFNLLFSLLLLSTLSYGQSSSDSNLALYALIALGGGLIFWVITSLADNLLKIEAEKSGIDPQKNDIGVLPNLGKMFKAKAPEFVNGNGSFHKLKKGFDINLKGKADTSIRKSNGTRFSLKPQNYRGISPIPKVTVAVGDEVKAGEPIFFDKKVPEVLYSSPVSGEVVEIKRGDKRAITDIIILADKEQKYHTYDVPTIDSCDRQDIVNLMLSSGTWALLNQRPFDVVPGKDDVPANIFISTFDTAPLAPDSSMLIAGKEAAFQKGLDVLNKLTVGKVYLGLDGNKVPSAAFTNATGVEKNYFGGKHPAGNVGIQIHHTEPIRNEKVWTVSVQDVATIGELFKSGKVDFSRVVALTGAKVSHPSYVSTYVGANIGDLLKDNVDGENARIITGDVLTGKTSSMEEFLNASDDQITVIEEGNYNEMFGWLLPLNPRPSLSKTFPSFLMPKFEFEGDTNTHGEKRAWVVSGQYESVLPMDIYPQHLMKAILANDFERMEGLGINELSEEDIAICEFVCTSKQPLQSILRQGLDMMREQS